MDLVVSCNNMDRSRPDYGFDAPPAQQKVFSIRPLAPLQKLMLNHSLSSGSESSYVEQLEVIFAEAYSAEQVTAAWQQIVARTQALRMAFITATGEPETWLEVDLVAPLKVETIPPLDWQDWLHQDRQHTLLSHCEAPWRVCYWPANRRWLWSFHHALLDGRSITRIIAEFLKALTGSNRLPRLELKHWRPAGDVEITAARQFYLRELASIDAVEMPSHEPGEFSSVRIRLGTATAKRLEMTAAKFGVSAHNLIIWAWAHAVIEISGRNFAVIEQLRCGAQQRDHVGFSMNLLPQLVSPKNSQPLAQQLAQFRQQSQQLRDFESIDYEHLPAALRQLTTQPWSSVIMTEQHTLADFFAGQLEFIELHEEPAQSLTATAFLWPNLTLQVEGPDATRLIQCWKKWLQI
jgi:Condensation domain